MNFHTYIHAVGTGEKINRDLNYEESLDMITQILTQKPYPEQIAAFLLGWRLKPESTTEFSACVEVFDRFIKHTPVANSLELGYPYDGKVNNPYILPLVAKILSATNLNLVVCGDDLIPAKGGITIKDLASNYKLNENVHYFNRSNFFKELHNLTQLRNRLGLRTGLNTIEKLTSVAKSKYAITGVFHKPFVKKYAEVFASRYERLALLQGNEGTPELFSKARLWIVHSSSDIEEFIIDPEAFGITYAKSWQSITLQESLEQLQNPSSEFIKLAKLNAAIYLFVANYYKSIEEAFSFLDSIESF